MKAMKQFVLVDGYAKMNNEQFFIDINNLKKDVAFLKPRVYWFLMLIVFLKVFLIPDVFQQALPELH